MSDKESNVNTDLFKNIERLRQLRIEHRDLDDVISRLSMDFKVDELQMKRLKRRKLMLKDQIARSSRVTAHHRDDATHDVFPMCGRTSR